MDPHINIGVAQPVSAGPDPIPSKPESRPDFPRPTSSEHFSSRSFSNKVSHVSASDNGAVVIHIPQLNEELEFFLAKLDAIFIRLDKVDAQGKAKKWVFRRIKDFEHVKDGFDYLESLFPEELFGDAKLKDQWDNKALGIGGALLKAINSGFKIYTIIYRIKILHEAERVLNEVKRKYEGLSLPLPPEVVAWEKRIREESDSLFATRVKDVMKITKNVFSLLKPILKVLPQYPMVKKGKDLLDRLKLIPCCLKATLSVMSCFDAISGLKSFYEKTGKFRQWKQLNQPNIKPGFAPPEQILKSSSKTDYEIELLNVIDAYDPQEKIEFSKYMRKHGVAIKENMSLDHFLAAWHSDHAFQITVVTQFQQYQVKVEVLEHLVQSSENLLQKRLARDELMFLRFKPHVEEMIPELQRLAFPHFGKRFNQILLLASKPESTLEMIKKEFEDLHLEFPIGKFTREDIFTYLSEMKTEEFKILRSQWFYRSTDRQLQFYIQHQETMSLTAKNALKELVEKKHAMEHKFLIFDLIDSTLKTSALLFWILSISSTPTVVAMLLIGFAMNYHYRPETCTFKAYWEKAQLLYAKLRKVCKDASLKASEQRYKELALEIDKMDLLPAGQKDKKKYDAAKEEFKALAEQNKKEEKVLKQLSKQVDELEVSLRKKAWLDFEKFAELTSSPKFNTLDALEETLKKCNLLYTDPEMKDLLLHLGIDPDALEEKKKKDPFAVRKALEKFFALQGDKLVSHLEKHDAFLIA